MPPEQTRPELALGHLLALCLAGATRCVVPNEPWWVPGEPGALSWETVRIVWLLANAVYRTASWTVRTWLPGRVLESTSSSPQL